MPVDEWSLSERTPLTLTHCDLSVIKSKIHPIIFISRFKSERSFSTSKCGWIVLKTEEKSLKRSLAWVIWCTFLFRKYKICQYYTFYSMILVPQTHFYGPFCHTNIYYMCHVILGHVCKWSPVCFVLLWGMNVSLLSKHTWLHKDVYASELLILFFQRDCTAYWPKELVLIFSAVGGPSGGTWAGPPVVWKPGHYGNNSTLLDTHGRR